MTRIKRKIAKRKVDWHNVRLKIGKSNISHSYEGTYLDPSRKTEKMCPLSAEKGEDGI